MEVDEARAVDIVLQPGEMSLHHVRLVHGSPPNRSDDRRIGFAIRYIPTRVRQLSDGGTARRSCAEWTTTTTSTTRRRPPPISITPPGSATPRS